MLTLRCSLALSLLAGSAFCQTLPPGVEKKAALGGVTEYDFPNGLRVLLFPDPASPKITINMTYLVGSRFEGYGETGMAHLLEHMNFIETTSGRQIKKELVDRGASWNGTTSEDRTNYFETVPSTDENLIWALGLEADRMVNMKMAKELLDTEMTVVRNEFERGENNPRSVLAERVESTAYLWHNYGKSTIGSREDIERVPIDRLAAFYRKYYQPDNAVLVIAGRIDESKALAFVADTIGKIPRPGRTLDQTYTVEPPQDGERFVELRRVGEGKEVMLAYHGPASAHPDSAALQVLSGIMSGGGGGGRGGGGVAQGRLSKALVDTKKANSVNMTFGLEHDPGLIEIEASLSKDQSQDEVRKIIIDTLEGVVKEAPTSEEVERAKTRLTRNLENQMSDSENFGRSLSNPIAQGDWRLVFLQHDRLKEVTPTDVVRVAKAYLKASNRTVGYFTPDPNPDRTVVPEAPELNSLLNNYKTDVNISRGESFDPTPANIEARVKRGKLANGMRVVMLNKQTANNTVFAVIELNFGDQQTLAGRNAVAQMASALLMRGTKTKTRQQLQDAMDKLNARITVNGGGGGGGRGGGAATGGLSSANASVQAPAQNFDAALRLAVEILREPAYPDADFDQLKTQRVKALENAPTEPQQLAQEVLQRHLSPYGKGDAQYVGTREDQLVAMRKLTLADVKKFHDQFYGASHGVIALLGSFDQTTVQKTVNETLGSWSVPGAYRRLTASYKKADAINQKIEAPDKANAQFDAAIRIPMSQDDPDYAALVLANYMLGGAITARVPDRIRNREGLSYSVSTSFTAPAEGNAAIFSASAISNPANTPKVETSFMDELRKAIDSGFTADEVATAKKAYRDAQMVSRSQDSALLTLLASREQLERTLQWDAQMDAKIQSLTPEQVSAAFRRHIDASAVSIVKAGDFRAAKVYQ
jgi:zinc protease